MENGREVSYHGINRFDHRHAWVIGMFFSILGQIIAGSGGPLFVMEVIATAVVFFITGGGLTTFSSSKTAECWFRLIAFSFCSSFAYMTGRLGIIDGVRKRRLAAPTKVLLLSILVVSVLWISLIFQHKWPTPSSIFILDEPYPSMLIPQ